jgi:hypothetical protein
MGGACSRTHPAHFSVVVVAPSLCRRLFFRLVIPQGSASVVAFALALVFACLRQTPPKLCHFDRSCSQPHREQRSGETRFSTHAAPQPRHRL